MKVCMLDTGYKQVLGNTTCDKNLIKQGGYSNLNSSTLNQILGISIKKFVLVEVLIPLQRALIVDAQGETSSLDKLPYHIKVSFIEGGYCCKMFTVEENIF